MTEQFTSTLNACLAKEKLRIYKELILKQLNITDNSSYFFGQDKISFIIDFKDYELNNKNFLSHSGLNNNSCFLDFIERQIDLKVKKITKFLIPDKSNKYILKEIFSYMLDNNLISDNSTYGVIALSENNTNSMLNLTHYYNALLIYNEHISISDYTRFYIYSYLNKHNINVAEETKNNIKLYKDIYNIYCESKKNDKNDKNDFIQIDIKENGQLLIEKHKSIKKNISMGIPLQLASYNNVYPYYGFLFIDNNNIPKYLSGLDNVLSPNVTSSSICTGELSNHTFYGRSGLEKCNFNSRYNKNTIPNNYKEIVKQHFNYCINLYTKDKYE